MTIAGVTRELLVRYLDVWTPAALHSAKRVTFAYAWSGSAGSDDRTQTSDRSELHAATAEAALRGFAEFDAPGRCPTIRIGAASPNSMTCYERAS